MDDTLSTTVPIFRPLVDSRMPRLAIILCKNTASPSLVTQCITLGYTGLRLSFLLRHFRLLHHRHATVIKVCHKIQMNTTAHTNHIQESRAAARKPRDAASVLFGGSSPTTFLTSIRLAMLRKPRFRAPNMLAQNTI